MIRALARYFTRLTDRRPVVVNHYKVKETDLQKARRETTAQLARELGRPNPLRGA